jgi:DNA modification methylase
MLNTDPPYGLGGYAGRSKKFDPVIGDDEDTLRFYQILPTSIKERYVWCEWKTYPILIKALGLPRSLIVWAKNNFGMGNGYRRKHEFCAYYGDFNSTTESDLWEVSKDVQYSHPTQKPVELAVRAINNSSKPGNIVIDYFLGSGFTLIACENLGRKCRGCEIDPGYVAVTLQRYKDTFPEKEIRLVKE